MKDIFKFFWKKRVFWKKKLDFVKGWCKLIASGMDRCKVGGMKDDQFQGRLSGDSEQYCNHRSSEG